jgi:phosphoribosylformylglycinamidine cyclo-ligase
MASVTQSDLIGYDALDRYKRIAQEVTARSRGDIGRLDLEFVEWTRGESVQLYEHKRYDFYLAQVNEGLGTKNLVADEMYWRNNWRSYDRAIAIDTVNMIVNDMITGGAVPISVPQHVAMGSKAWLKSEVRVREFLEGWLQACTEARCRYDSGETPILSGLVNVGSAVLSGSAIGIVSPKSRVIRRNIQAGDAIVLLESSGIHANGLTLARKIAGELREGYMTRMANGRLYGEALLDPTYGYVGFMEDCLNADIQIRYAVNITGHGWRKLMRAPEPFEYVIEKVPTAQEIFRFIAEKGGISQRDMYADYNMGAGFALIVPRYQAYRIAEIWKNGNYPFSVISNAGHVRQSDTRKVFIKPLDITFQQDELQVR